MKRSNSRERLGKGAKGLEAGGLAKVGEMFSGLSQHLPNNQKSKMPADAQPMTDVETYDLRTNKKLKDVKGQDVTPVALEIDGRLYRNQVRFGGYRFETPFATTKIVGLTNFGNGLYVQPAPLQPFLRAGQTAVGKYEQLQGKRIDDRTEEGKAQIAGIVKNGAIDGGGRSYRNACFEAIHEDSPNKTITVLVLGPQRADGRHENAEAYEELSNGSKNELSPNIHEFQGMQQVRGNNGELINVRVIHANVSKFDEQHLGSTDLERLFSIYTDTLGSGNPLTIHCTDGLDRAGGISFAMHLMRNYDNVFVPGNEEQTLSNIMKQHAFMQDQRGGFFCTANEGRLIGAFQLATIMKSIEMSRTLLNSLQKTDPANYEYIEGKNYVEQIEMLAGQNYLSHDAKKLLSVLVTRARTEEVYFAKFAKEIKHPLIEKFNQLDAKYQLRQQQNALLLIDNIDEMLQKGHNLDPLIRRRGQESQQEEYIKKLGRIKSDILDGKNPADFFETLKGMNDRLAAAPPGFSRLTRKAAVSEPSKTAAASSPASEVVAKKAVEPSKTAAASSPAPVVLAKAVEPSKTAVASTPAPAVVAKAVEPSKTAAESSPSGSPEQTKKQTNWSRAVQKQEAVRSPKTLTGSMLAKSRVGVKKELSEEEQVKAAAEKVRDLAILNESGSPGFEITFNNKGGDYQQIVNNAKREAEDFATITESEHGCVIKIEDTSIHLSKAENGETRLEVRSPAGKEDKALLDAASIVTNLGNTETHKENSLKVRNDPEGTKKEGLQLRIEELHSQRTSSPSH